jgi:hypothetical protein
MKALDRQLGFVVPPLIASAMLKRESAKEQEKEEKFAPLV